MKPLTADQLERVARKYCAIQGIEPDEHITDRTGNTQRPRWQVVGMSIREHDALAVLCAEERERGL